MGNYKSRPQLSCADELKKRISEGYAIVRSKLNDDIKPKFDARTTCVQGTAEEFLSQLDQLEFAVDEKIGVNELSLLHLICIGACEQSEKIRLLLERFNNDKFNQKINRRKSFLEQRTRNGFTPLHIAIYKGEKEATITLLSSGANPNGVQPIGVPPPLHLAAMTGNAELIEILISHGADLKSQDFVRYTALHCAAYFGHEMAVKELLAAGADPNACGSVHDRPAFLAVGADPKLEDDEGNTSLHFAAKTGHSSSISLLLSKAGEEIRRQFALKTNIYGDTALHSACYMGRTDAAKQLLNAIGSEVLSMENLFSETPLMAACTAGRFELVCFLMRQPEVDPNHQAQDGHTGKKIYGGISFEIPNSNLI
uniref:ANK_REP_REGION domain-containing protein n=1 Tax=Meloidogyne hapla TaxID=6305 RepID=A0A1I8AX76_MELHA